MNPTSPTSLLHVPHYGSSPRPEPTRVAEPVGGYNPTNHVPPTPPMPTLTIGRRVKHGKVVYNLYLHESIRAALGLRDGQPIALRPPEYDSKYWHLDLRPSASYLVKWYSDQRPRVEAIRLPDGLVNDTLVLHLLPGTPAYEGYYPMIAL